MILSQGLVLERKAQVAPCQAHSSIPFSLLLSASSLGRFGISTLAGTALGFGAIIASVLEKSEHVSCSVVSLCDPHGL